MYEELQVAIDACLTQTEQLNPGRSVLLASLKESANSPALPSYGYRFAREFSNVLCESLVWLENQFLFIQ